MKRGRVDNIGSLHKIGGLAPVCQLCKETLKIFHPPIIKPTHIRGFPPISSKNSLNILEKFHPPFMKEEGRGI